MRLRRLARVALLVLPLLLAAQAAAAKSYKAEEYASRIRVLWDGSLDVTEDVRFRFEGGPFTHVYRTLPLRKVDGIDSLSSPEEMRVRRRRSMIEVTWRFPAARDTVRTIRLAYRVRGAMRLDGGKPTLEWTMFPEEHAYRIDRAHALLLFPPYWPEAEMVDATAGAVQPMSIGPGWRFEVGALKAEKTAVLKAQFAAGAVAIATPGWQQQREAWRQRTPGLLAIALAALVLSLLAVLASFRRGGAARIRKGEIPSVSAPPSDLAAPLAGALHDGDASMRHAVACLADLAARGAVRFEASPRGPRWMGTRYLVRRLASPADAPPWERIVLDGVFRKASAEGTVSVHRAWNGLWRNVRSFRDRVREEMLARGDFDPDAVAARRSLNLTAVPFVVLAVAGVVVGALLADRVGPAVFASSAAFAIAAFVARIGSTVTPLWSGQGRQRALAWRGFSRSMKETAKGSAPVAPARFTEWLPYALAFGLAERWFKAGKRWGVPPPPWLQGVAGEPGNIGAWAAIFAVAHGGGAGGASGFGGAAGGGGSGAG